MRWCIGSRCPKPAMRRKRRASLTRRQTEGKPWREALRALKRHLIRAIWRQWQQCLAIQERGGEASAA